MPTGSYTKSSKGSKTSTTTTAPGKLTKKDEEIIKKKLKELLKKEKNASSARSQASTSGRSTSCRSCNYSSKSSSRTDDKVFKKKNSNSSTNQKSSTKKTVLKSNSGTRKTATKRKNTTACSGGVCPYVAPKSKPKSTTSKSSKAKSTMICTSSGCFFRPTVTKDVTKTNSTHKRKAPEPEEIVIPIKNMKKSTQPLKTEVSNKNSNTASVKDFKQNLQGNKKQSTQVVKTIQKYQSKKPVIKKNVASRKVRRESSQSSCSCCDCEEDDDSDEDESSYSDSESDFDDSDEYTSSDDYGSKGSCRFSNGNRNAGKRNFSRSDSWETESDDSDEPFDCPDGTCSYIRKRDDTNKTNNSIKTNSSNFDNSNSWLEEEVLNGHNKTDLSLVCANLKSASLHSSSEDDSWSYEEEDEEESEVSDLEEEEGTSFEEEESITDFEDEDEESSYEDAESNSTLYERCLENNLSSYDSSDEDYELPEDELEDVYVRKGEATTYPLRNKNISFDNDNTQILEIADETPCKDNESEDSCPQLIPITNPKSNTFCAEDYSSEIECGSNEEEMKPHIIEVTKEDLSARRYVEGLKDISEVISQKCKNNSNNEQSDDLSPLTKLENNSTCKDASSYKVITADAPRQKVKSTIDSRLQKIKCNTKFYNSYDCRQVLMLLKDPIYVYGTIKLTVIAGALEIFGYKPEKDETLELYSPAGYSSLCLKPIENENTQKMMIKEDITKFNDVFLSFEMDELFELFNEKTDAIVLMERNDRDKKVSMLKKYMREQFFPNTNLLKLERPFYASEFILRCIFYLQCDNPLRISSTWEKISVKNSSKIMIIGGKSVGKSTLLRYVINNNLKTYKEFLLIDLDIGQPETFLPQTVSATIINKPLLGPGYFYELMPEKSYMFGDVNVILSPFSYLRNVKELIKFCDENERFKNIPWIINTMGYNKGFGSELISVIAQILNPTDIVQIQSTREISNFDFVMSPEIIKTIPRNLFVDERPISEYQPMHQLIMLKSILKGKNTLQGWDMVPKNLRYAIIISHLGRILKGIEEWLTDVKPMCASIDDINIISFGEDFLEKEDLLDAINANLVYLCRNTTNCVECYGIGIVRAVDKVERKIYAIHPLPFDILKNVDTLAIGNIPLPSSIILNQGPKIRGIVPYAYNTSDSVASKQITQLYYRPPEFLQGTPKKIL